MKEILAMSKADPNSTVMRTILLFGIILGRVLKF